MWPGWKAKYLSSHAAGLDPARAHAILDEFLRNHPEYRDTDHATEKGQVEGHGFVEHQRNDEVRLSPEAGGGRGSLDSKTFP